MSKSMREMLSEQRNSLAEKARAILDKAEGEKRDLNAEENRDFDKIKADMDSLRTRLEQLEKFENDVASADRALAPFNKGTATRAGDTWVNTATGKPVGLRSNESLAASEFVQERAAERSQAEDTFTAMYENIPGFVRAMSNTSGSAIVPVGLAAEVIDLARNKSAVMKAGATTIVMDQGTVNIGRLTGDPTAAFRTEGSAVTPSDVTLDNVTLTAKTMSCLVVGSMEWFMDAENASAVVQNAIAQAIATKLDLVALYGAIVAGAGSINLPLPPNPRGILAALNATKPANVLGAATNGTAQTAATFYGEVLDTIFAVKNSNETPNAMIWNSKLERLYAGAADTTNQPLQAPAIVTDLPHFSSNQIPSYTQGTMANVATDLFVGDFTQLLVGSRLGLTIQVLTERYADLGQIGVVAHLRTDIGLARSGAFAVYKALKGA